MLSRTQRIFFLKIIALLSIVRWYNILITAAAQYLTAIYVFTPGQKWKEVLWDIDIHLIALSTTLIIAAGYIINSFYDLEKDLVNRPEHTIFGRLVSKSFCLYCYLAFNIIAVIIALFVSFNVFVYFSLFALALWFYSHKLQRIPVVRELSASLLSVASVLVIGLFYAHISLQLLFYAFMLMLVLFNKEIIKDEINIEGDALYDYKTIPIYFGSTMAFQWLTAFSIMAIGCAIFFLVEHTELIFEFFMFVMVILLVWVMGLMRHPDRVALRMSNNLYKVLIVIGLVMSIYL